MLFGRQQSGVAMLNALLVGYVKINTVLHFLNVKVLLLHNPLIFNSSSLLELHKMEIGLCVVQVHNISIVE
jgi:hypothetical protein